MKSFINGRMAASAVAMLAVVVGCTWMALSGIMHPVALILMVPACWPLARTLHREVALARLDVERKLMGSLPRIGCEVESIKRGDDGKAVRMVVKYRGETLVFDAERNDPYLTIWDPAWLVVPASDPDIPKFLEAMNATNRLCGAVVALSDPDEDGNRRMHTIYSTILPERYVSSFLDSTLIHILNKKVYFRDNFKDYPWLAKDRKRPIGFSMNSGGGAVDGDSLKAVASAQERPRPE